jgi:hypothetical protein
MADASYRRRVVFASQPVAIKKYPGHPTQERNKSPTRRHKNQMKTQALSRTVGCDLNLGFANLSCHGACDFHSFRLITHQIGHAMACHFATRKQSRKKCFR